MENRITLLGTGTSQGIPMIGCGCPVCTSTDIHDKRLRTSARVEYNGIDVVIDAGPDFRQQMLRENICNPDAILLTHKHIDHTGGLDDVRSYNYFKEKAMPIYCESMVAESLKQQFYYAFEEKKYPGAPDLELHLIDDKPFEINGTEIIPLRVLHYKMPILGYRFGDLAYITDGSFIPEETFEKLSGIKILIINCVRREKHISHFCLDEAVKIAEITHAEKTYLTHISHQLGKYSETEKSLPENIRQGYDGLKIEF